MADRHDHAHARGGPARPAAPNSMPGIGRGLGRHGQAHVVAQQLERVSRAPRQALAQAVRAAGNPELGCHVEHRVPGRVLDGQQAVGGPVEEVVLLHALGPALHERHVVGGVALELAPSGGALEVVDDAVRRVADLPALRADAQAEVDVLPAVDESGVKAADLLESLAADEHGRGGDGLEAARPVDGRMALVEALVQVAAVLCRVEDDAGVLDRVVGPEQLGPDDRGAGMLLGAGDQGVEPAGARQRVVVEEDQVAPVRGSGPVVAGGRKARLLEAPDLPDVEISRARRARRPRPRGSPCCRGAAPRAPRRRRG